MEQTKKNNITVSESVQQPQYPADYMPNVASCCREFNPAPTMARNRLRHPGNRPGTYRYTMYHQHTDTWWLRQISDNSIKNSTNLFKSLFNTYEIHKQ